MRDVYTAKLSRLSDEILEMGNLCGQAIMKTCQLLASVEVREAATKEIGRIEKEIDDKEHNIEALCMQLLLKQQPVGTDLRKISAALKMVTDMERIGDQATDIAEILNTGSVHVPVTAIPLQEMADYAMHMVNDSVTAYVEEKSDLAKKVISSDDILDNLFNKVRNALDQNTMDFSSDEVLDLLMISKYYERIGDHAMNIAECAKEIEEKGIVFSHEADRELSTLFSAVQEITHDAITAFTTGDLALAYRVERVELDLTEGSAAPPLPASEREQAAAPPPAAALN